MYEKTHKTTAKGTIPEKIGNTINKNQRTETKILHCTASFNLET